MSIEQHNLEIAKNLATWNKKPLLHRVYRDFHQRITRHLANLPGCAVVELGSGIGNIKEAIPYCLRTDIFPNPWIEQVENAYRLSFADQTISDLILIDVFHHLRYPGAALREFWRVLAPGGHVILFEPYLGLLGLTAYGLFHREPLGLLRPIKWFAPSGWSPDDIDYYASQGNATRIFTTKAYRKALNDWRMVAVEKIASVSYIASGGYSGPQLYPERWYHLAKALDRFLSPFPLFFGTRLLVVLEKPAQAHCQG